MPPPRGRGLARWTPRQRHQLVGLQRTLDDLNTGKFKVKGVSKKSVRERLEARIEELGGPLPMDEVRSVAMMRDE